ncbi:hypothetical protein VTO42DRAFT_1291 [Malbranchea cinnamomea]
MFSSFFFISWRLGQVIILIPPVGMLAWFVDGFLKENMLTPSYILVLFIVSVLAVVWALETLIRYGSTKRSAIFVCFVDLCFFGAFIAGVYQLRGIGNKNCNHFSRSGPDFLNSLGPFGYWGRSQNNPLADNPNKVCAMLKTSFAFGIMNVVSFFVTAFFAYMLHRHEERQREKESRRSHSTRRGHGRRRSSSTRRGDYYV